MRFSGPLPAAAGAAPVGPVVGACACRHFILRLGGPVRRGFPCSISAFPRATEADGAGIAQVRNQPVETTAWLTMQSAAKQSPYQNSLLTGKITGNFAESDHSPTIFMSDQYAEPIAYGRIPYATEQGIFKGVSGNFFKEQGISTAEPLVCSPG
jgi:hypothetical protein